MCRSPEAARCPEGRTLTWELAFDALKELRALGETDDALDFRPLVNAASVGRQRDSFQTLVRLRDRLSRPPSGKEFPAQDFGGAVLRLAKVLAYGHTHY